MYECGKLTLCIPSSQVRWTTGDHFSGPTLQLLSQWQTNTNLLKTVDIWNTVITLRYFVFLTIDQPNRKAPHHTECNYSAVTSGLSENMSYIWIRVLIRTRSGFENDIDSRFNQFRGKDSQYGKTDQPLRVQISIKCNERDGFSL